MQKKIAGISNATFACLDAYLVVSAQQELSNVAESFDQCKISPSLRDMSFKKKLLGKLGSLGF